MPVLSTTVLQQTLLASLSVLLVAASASLLRRSRLGFAGAMLWIGMGTIGAVGAAFLPVVNAIGDFLGVLPAAVLTGVASLLLGTIAFLLALQVARIERSLQETVEAIGVQNVTPPLAPADDSSILALVPAFNEVDTIGKVVADLHALDLPVLVIDDGSTDGTGHAARQSGSSVLRLHTNLGVGGALRAGLRYARLQGFSTVIQCDGDGQHPPEAVAALLSNRSDEFDLLLGSRFDGGFAVIPAMSRRIAIQFLSRLASRAAGGRITDSTSGLRIIQGPLLAELARRMPSHYLGDTFEVVHAAGRAGYRIREIPVTMIERSHGTSTASTATAVKMTLRVVITSLLRVHLPLKAADVG